MLCNLYSAEDQQIDISTKDQSSPVTMAQDDFMAFDDAPEAGASIKKEKGPREK
jgi:hypothetical protein